jgi:hypothetical protein
MTPKFKAMLESYIRNLAGQVAGAIVIVGHGANPSTFTSSQWVDVSNALWASLIPVIVRYINKKDPAFGMIAKPLLEKAEVATATAIKKTAKKAPAKKAPAKKTSVKGK